MTTEKTSFGVGDIVVDVINNEIGVLLRRFNLYHTPPYSEMEELDDACVVVWDVFWCGPSLWPMERVQAYTEEGLEILLEAEVLVLHKNT